MAWFKVDDHMGSHPASFEIGDTALGYWLRLGCWLARFPQQHGFISSAVAKHLLYGERRRPRLDALISAGLLVPEGDGYRMYPLMDICGSGLEETMWQVDLPQLRRRPIPEATRLEVYARDEHACVHCGASEPLTLDHIWPWSRGGSDDPSNLQTLCGPCNSRKGDRV